MCDPEKGELKVKQTDPHKRGKASREKGKRGELELAKTMNGMGFDVHRGKVFYGEADIEGFDDIHAEVKRVEKLNYYKALEQAAEEAEKKDGKIPVLFSRKNGKQWLVTMYLTDGVYLMNKWKGEKHE